MSDMLAVTVAVVVFSIVAIMGATVVRQMWREFHAREEPAPPLVKEPNEFSASRLYFIEHNPSDKDGEPYTIWRTVDCMRDDSGCFYCGTRDDARKLMAEIERLNT